MEILCPELECMHEHSMLCPMTCHDCPETIGKLAGYGIAPGGRDRSDVFSREKVRDTFFAKPPLTMTYEECDLEEEELNRKIAAAEAKLRWIYIRKHQLVAHPDGGNCEHGCLTRGEKK